MIITTHYIEEARQANVVGLMRHGKILAENSPDELMQIHGLTNLEDVFLKLCVTDSSRRAASMAEPTGGRYNLTANRFGAGQNGDNNKSKRNATGYSQTAQTNLKALTNRQLESKLYTRPLEQSSSESNLSQRQKRKLAKKAQITIHTRTNEIELNQTGRGYVNEAVEDLSSEDYEESEVSDSSKELGPNRHRSTKDKEQQTNFRSLIQHAGYQSNYRQEGDMSELHSQDYLALQAIKWAAKRTNELSLLNLKLNRGNLGKNLGNNRDSGFGQWWKTLMAVTWKNYVRLRRNPPVLIFQFMLPAIQVILFCLCIGGEPFDVPVAIVNDEVVPRSSQEFLDGLNKKIIRQIKYDNLTSAMDAVRRGTVWGAIHIPDKYSQNLQSRLIMGEEVNNETISNGTIRVYPDLTSK